jgi:Rieske Fe-S protein
MSISRREFLELTAAAIGCGTLSAMAGGGPAQTIDAGPASTYAADGVYDAYKDIGFFIVRRGGHLFALSSICTHRAVTLKAESDCTFYCKRHGSTFAADGHVTQGPAKRNLPVLSTSVNGAGHLLVNVSAA